MEVSIQPFKAVAIENRHPTTKSPPLTLITTINSNKISTIINLLRYLQPSHRPISYLLIRGTKRFKAPRIRVKYLSVIRHLTARALQRQNKIL